MCPRFVDRCRTTNNMLGDCYGAAVVEHLSRCSTVQYSTIQHITVQHSTVLHLSRAELDQDTGDQEEGDGECQITKI